MNHFTKVFLLLFINCTVFLVSLKAQLVNADTITISGVILDSDSLISLPNVHIVTHKNTGTVSDMNGQFAFKTNANDTLKFSFMGYKDYTFVVPDTLSYNNYMMGVLLNRDTILLSEIIILPWMNKEQFKSAFKNSQPDMELVNATQNLKMMGFTARAYAPSWTADQMVDYQLKQYTQNLEYKGMLAPSQSFNITGFAIYLIRLTKQQLNKDEKEYRLRQELHQYIQNNH